MTRRRSQEATLRGRVLLSGAIAGASTAVAFAALHHLLISDIWFSLLPMMAAGAVCGLCLAWAYVVVFEATTPATWLRYNLEFLALFVVLGALSFLLFEPVYTIQGLVAGTEAPDRLLGVAIPLAAGFGVIAGAAISALRGRTLRKATAIVTTCVVLSVLLGHNAAILGMVHMTMEAVPLLAQFYGLMAAILVGNATAFVILERRRLFAAPNSADAAVPQQHVSAPPAPPA
jgi:hypothetical protein